jgi:hypothetical protein
LQYYVKYDMGISEHDSGRDVDVRGGGVADECRNCVIRVRHVRGMWHERMKRACVGCVWCDAGRSVMEGVS